MRFQIHRPQQKRLTFLLVLALLGIVAPLQAQDSYSESYLTYNLPSGVSSVARKGNESAVMLFERQLTEFRFVGQELQEFEVTHRKYQIFDENALEDISSLYISLNNVKEVLFIKAVAVSPKGVSTVTDVSKIKSVEENGKNYKLLAVEGAEIGGTVELIYGLRKSATLYWGSYLGSKIRTLEMEYWVIHPRNFTMEHHVFNTDKFTQKDSIMGKETPLEAKADMYGFKDIPAMVSLGNYFPNSPVKYRVESSLRRNMNNSTGNNYEYNDIARISYNQISETKEKGSKEIRKVISEINLKDKTNERDKIIEVESYIKRHFGKDESNTGDNTSLKYLYANKHATEGAMIALYSGIFDQLGIKHDVGFVYDRTLKVVEPDFENWANLGEWIFRFPDSDTYILPTNFISPPGYTSNDYRNTQMIRIKALQLDNIVSAVADLVEVPKGPEFHQKEKLSISLDSDFAPTSRCEYEVSGNLAAHFKWLRDITVEDASIVVSLLKNLVEGRHKDQKVKNITYRFSDNYGSPDFNITITFELVPLNLVEKAGNNYIFYPGRYYHSNLTEAELPADYAYPAWAKENTFSEMEMEIPVPEGYKVEIPKDASPVTKLDLGEGRSLELETSVKNENGKVIIHIREEQKLGKVAPQDLPKLKGFMDTLAKMSKIYVVITKA